MFFELNLHSKELKMNTPVNVILPDRVEEGQTYKTLWLLHGLKGDHTSWKSLRFPIIFPIPREIIAGAGGISRFAPPFPMF